MYLLAMLPCWFVGQSQDRFRAKVARLGKAIEKLVLFERPPRPGAIISFNRLRRETDEISTKYNRGQEPVEKRGNQTRWEPRATNVGHRLVFEKDIRTGEGPITLLLMLFILYGHDQTRPFILSLRSVPCRHPYSPRGAISVCRESFCMSHFYLFLSLSLSLSLFVTSTSLCQKYRLTPALPITYTYIYI